VTSAFTPQDFFRRELFVAEDLVAVNRVIEDEAELLRRRRSEASTARRAHGQLRRHDPRGREARRGGDAELRVLLDARAGITVSDPNFHESWPYHAAVP